MKQNGNQKNKRNNSCRSNDPLSTMFKLSPQQIAVIAALLTNSLEVDSILIDKDQEIQITLKGTIKKKTERDKLIEQINGLTVGELIQGLLGK